MPQDQSQTPTAAAPRTRPGIAAQQARILASAVELFGRKGTRATSISAICQHADVSRDTFYRCFDDKDALVSALYQRSVNAHVVSALDTPELHYEDREWLVSVFDATVDAIVEQQHVARLLFLESTDPDSHAHAVINRAFSVVARRMQAWYRKRHGRTQERAYFVALLVAAQWLVQDAILKGCGARQVSAAKRNAVALFYSAMNPAPGVAAGRT